MAFLRTLVVELLRIFGQEVSTLILIALAWQQHREVQPNLLNAQDKCWTGMDDPRFVLALWLGCGWASAEVLAGSYQLYKFVPLYRAMGQPTLDEEDLLTDYVEDNRSEDNEDGSALSTPSLNKLEEMTLDELILMREKTELEAQLGEYLENVPPAIITLWRLDSVLWQLGTCLLMSAAIVQAQGCASVFYDETPYSAPSTTVPKRSVKPFLRDDSILLVGEGNFSFTLALLSAPYHHPPHRILATSYDSEEEVYKKYPDARDIIHQIRQMSGAHASRILAFNVDAGALHKCDAVTGTNKSDQRRWSKVWFGFPHVGAGHKDEHRNVLANQLLILRFLISVAPYLTEGPLPEAIQGRKRRAVSEDDEDDEEYIESANDIPDVSATSLPPRRQGSVLITIRNVVPYTLWNIPMLGKRLRDVLQPIAASAPSPPKGMRAPTVSDVDKNGAQYVLWRSFEFENVAHMS
ncbi:25S rRNA (uracil(2634)-N(3))-methyltransferase [Malassezia arunalokei]|uniref:25S rRNA (Uracil(2634)-N(3))-methyltransferase n=1 Tax=Malassezia arunalokei TaxID=1514897 RepID=A0AAJ6CL32_9BASI|nr:25S rRNA (uracil(2634)-N(3))-methyltransferase [Malassezia arunalokei]